MHRSVRCRVVCAARKTNETSIRLALGATRVQVLGSVLKEGMLLVIAGMAISVPATLAATRLITSLGVKAADLNSLGLNTPVVRIGCANHSWRRLINWEKAVRP